MNHVLNLKMMDTNSNSRFIAFRSGYVPWGKLRDMTPEVKETIDICTEFSKSPDDLLQLLVADGLSYNQVAKELNFKRYRTAKGKRWTPMAVKYAAAKLLDTQTVGN